MKPALAALVLFTAPSFAGLIAHVQTDKGTIDVDLMYEQAPKAVANFMGLAEGTRSSIDPNRGGVREVPYYVGEQFFRVIDDPGFKIAQTGSGTGTNSGGPGYTFRDEFDPELTHVPYVLSMANSGPNTNGSQIFFTGSVPVNHLDNIHTVFGLITDESSRSVIDAILAAGTNGSSITAVTFERTDAAAQAFDISAQGLPSVLPGPTHLEVTPGESTKVLAEPPFTAGHALSVFKSTDLTTWASTDENFVGYDTQPSSILTIDDAASPNCFYSMARVESPESPTPGSLANRTLFFTVPGSTDTITFEFDETGEGGISTYSAQESPGSITAVNYDPSGYGGTMVIDSTNLAPLRLSMSFDGEEGPNLTGRLNVSVYAYTPSEDRFTWQSAGSGTHTLTK